MGIKRVISDNSTVATVCKASKGKLVGVYASNANAAARYLKFYDKATAPTVGTDVPLLTLMIPPAGRLDLQFGDDLRFANGISFALTTGIADSDTGAVTVSEHAVNVQFA